MAVLRAVAGEIASVVTHLVRYPTGVGRRWAVPAGGPRPESSEPIVLVPGLADNFAVFTGLRRALEGCGAGPVVSFGYSPLLGDVRSAATDLADHVERLCEVTGAPRVNLVGHSLGGLIARYYVQRLGGHTRVHSVVTVATPHRGTVTAWLLSPLPLVRQLRPGSDLLAELAAPSPGCATRFVTFSSDADAVILPARHAQIEHPDLTVRNLVVPGLGHLTLPGHRLVVNSICALLGPAAAANPPAEPYDAAPVERSA